MGSLVVSLWEGEQERTEEKGRYVLGKLRSRTQAVMGYSCVWIFRSPLWLGPTRICARGRIVSNWKIDGDTNSDDWDLVVADIGLD